MAGSSDPSRFLETLPSHPNREMQQKRAKELLRAVWADDALPYRNAGAAVSHGNR